MNIGKNAYKLAYKIDKYIETNPFFRLIGIFGAIIGGILACFTFYQIMVDLSDRRDERIIRSWDHLLKPVGGNTGKADAIEILFGYGINIDNIVIPCPAKNSDGSCGWRVILEGLFENKTLPFKELFRDGWQDTLYGYGVISGADFSYVDFKNAKLSKWVFEGLSAIDTSWKNVDLHASHINGDFRNAYFEAADFSSAFFDGDMTGTMFLLSNLSNATLRFYGTSEEGKPTRLPDFSTSWFWADQPPKVILNENEINLEHINIGFVCDFDRDQKHSHIETPASRNLLLATLEAGSGVWDIDCNAPISLEEAQSRYPMRYGNKQYECRDGDEGRSKWFRTEGVSNIAGC